MEITSEQARCFMLQATGLDSGFKDVAEALGHLGFVQIDPINVCGRMQDHILRHRVPGYGEQDLMCHLHQQKVRQSFEQHLPDSHNLAAMPVDAWPYLQKVMSARKMSDCKWFGKLDSDEKKIGQLILKRIASEGPLCSQDIEGGRKEKKHAWDSTTLAKSALQKLFFHGRVLIARRDGIRRYYDLPEKVLPAESLNATVPSSEEADRWCVLLKMRQRRLTILKSAEQRLIEDQVHPVSIRGTKLRPYILRSDHRLLEEVVSSSCETSPEPRLIAPLDPIIYDRRVTELVWNFDYRWEVYVPQHKRVRGYYALPLLHGDRFIGHADVKADRQESLLLLLAQSPARSKAAKAAIQSLANFLGCDRVVNKTY